MITARQKILNYINEEQSATVEELSRVFRVTPANIRHHLSILVDQGSLKIIGYKPKPGKGRPAQIYTSAPRGDQANLEQLAGSLLSTLLGNLAPQNTDHVLREIASRIVRNTNVDMHNPTRRVYSTIRALNRMSYGAHWEAHIENPRIMIGHCPYINLLEHHPEVCHLDKFILQELLDTPIIQTEKLAANAKGLPECVFLLRHATA